MEQHQTHHEYSACSRHGYPQSVGWKVFWSISWMLVGLPWLLIFWWPHLWWLFLVIMFFCAFFVYVLVPRALFVRNRRKPPSLSDQPLQHPFPPLVYERGYQEQRSGGAREPLDDLSQSQTMATWDDEQPQASYPE
jgi:hypothetical protein